jgi:hypothetical protein
MVAARRLQMLGNLQCENRITALSVPSVTMQKKREKIERQEERAATRPENADPQPIAHGETPEC